jgi:hypothetical protein
VRSDSPPTRLGQAMAKALAAAGRRLALSR